MKPIYQIIFCFFSCLLWSTLSFAQSEDGFLSAIIEFRPNGELSVLKGHCKNHTAAPLFLSYKLNISHTGSGGTSTQNLSGEFDINPRKKQEVAISKLSYNPGDALFVLLQIFSAGELVATDTLQIKAQKKEISSEVLTITEDILKKKRALTAEELVEIESNAIKPKKESKKRPEASKAKVITPKPVSPTKKESIPPKVVETPKPKNEIRSDKVIAPQEDIGIDGLIIDETRTKMAHDFYDLFYRKWTNPQGAKDYIIYIREMPSRGRVAQVSLFVNDDEVVRRHLSPRFELLEQQVNLSIRILIRHLKKNESVKEQLGAEDSMGSGIF